MPVKPIPDGYHAITPYLLVPDVDALIDFVQRSFGAAIVHRMTGPDEKVMHAEVQIGDSRVMMGTGQGRWKPMPCMLYAYVLDVDATYKLALAAGAESASPPADQFYGDRTASVKDMAGNHWYIATHKEDVAPEELSRRAGQKR